MVSGVISTVIISITNMLRNNGLVVARCGDSDLSYGMREAISEAIM